MRAPHRREGELTTATETAPLPFGDRFSLGIQRGVGRLLSPLWVPLSVAIMRFGFRWRIDGIEETRLQYRGLRGKSSAPLIVCANHLTLVDSFLVAWSLGSSRWLLTHFASLPWNLPDRDNFSRSLLVRVLVYVMRCVPVDRGGNRREIANSLARVAYLLSRGEVALIFPEGGRSRTGRIDAQATTYGVGRIVKSVRSCRVLCVHVRGEGQVSWSKFPARGERFHVLAECFEPKSDRAGLRGSVEIGRQILGRLQDLERRHFEDLDDRQ